MADDLTPRLDDVALTSALDRVDLRMNGVRRSANAFGRAMSDAFSQSILGSRNFEDVLKQLYLRLSDIALRLTFKPVENALAGGLSGLFGGGTPNSSGLVAASGAIKPFAAGGVIGTPTYFPLRGGGLGIAGEAGPEAILPLARGRDGRLGIAAAGGTGGSITVNIATPDAESFRRSEVYVTGQIARAVARGQRGM
jgi:phage-related minor tail protein